MFIGQEDFLQEAGGETDEGEPCAEKQCVDVERWNNNNNNNNNGNNNNDKNSNDDNTNSNDGGSTQPGSSENPVSCTESSAAARAPKHFKTMQTMKRLSSAGGGLRKQLIRRIGNSKPKPEPKPEFVIAGTSCWIWPEDSEFRLRCFAVSSLAPRETTCACAYDQCPHRHFISSVYTEQKCRK